MPSARARISPTSSTLSATADWAMLWKTEARVPNGGAHALARLLHRRVRESAHILLILGLSRSACGQHRAPGLIQRQRREYSHHSPPRAILGRLVGDVARWPTANHVRGSM